MNKCLVAEYIKRFSFNTVNTAACAALGALRKQSFGINKHHDRDLQENHCGVQTQNLCRL